MPTKAWLIRPRRPNMGSQATARIKYEVQNGTMHNRNSASCHLNACTCMARK